MTDRADIIYGGASGAPVSLAKGSSRQIISPRLNDSSQWELRWEDITPTHINSVPTDRLLGRYSALTGEAQTVSLAGLLKFESGALDLYVTRGSKLVGKGGSAGTAEEINLGTNLSMDGNTLNATGGAAQIEVITELDDNTTLSAANHANKYIPVNKSSLVTISIPTGFAVNDVIVFEQRGIGQVYLAPSTTDVAIRSSETRLTETQYSVVAIKCVSINAFTDLETWTMFGERELL